MRLFDGRTLFGWEAMGGLQAGVEQGAIVLRAAKGGGWLRSFAPFADFELELEFQTTANVNSGVYLRSAAMGVPSTTGYEVQISATHPAGYTTGSLVGIQRPRRSPSLAPGRWQTLAVRARGSSFQISIDGREVLAARAFRSAAGFIGLQPPSSGTIRFRQIRLRPLDAMSIFNGRDLTGWRGVDPEPPAPQLAEWSVRDGVLHVEKGPGQLETEQAWDNFLLQFDFRVNTIDPRRHPASAVFLRGDQDVWFSGYAMSIRNQGGAQESSTPAMTGSLTGKAAARELLSVDNEWATALVAASGRQFAVFVNGALVTRFEDGNPEGTKVSEGKARLVRGTIALGALDGATDIDFRNLCVAPLPRLDTRGAMN